MGYEEFYEMFRPNKVKYKTPGRDWDDEGLASWYIEEIEAPIDGELFVKLLAFLNYWQAGETTLLKGVTEHELIEQLKLALVKTCERLAVDCDLEEALAFKREVKTIIDEYHEQWEED